MAQSSSSEIANILNRFGSLNLDKSEMSQAIVDFFGDQGLEDSDEETLSSESTEQLLSSVPIEQPLSSEPTTQPLSSEPTAPDIIVVVNIIAVETVNKTTQPIKSLFSQLVENEDDSKIETFFPNWL